MKYNQKFYISKTSRSHHIFNLPAFLINNVYVQYYQELYSRILNQFFLSYDIFQTSQAFQKQLRHLWFSIQTEKNWGTILSPCFTDKHSLKILEGSIPRAMM
jgi:hypothetical protein